MTEPRQWAMYAHHRDDLPDGREFMHLGHPRYVEAHGTRWPIVPVVLTEDDEGGYWGWIDADDVPATPVMIQPHWGMFTMQFPYAPEAEVKRGKGEIVRLRVDLSDDDRTPVCGETYDHDLKLTGSRDGITTYECRECGAEVVDDEDAE